MANKSGTGPPISPHPFFANVPDPDTVDAVAFVGYVGPSSSRSIILYASLDDLSASVEILTADILHMADVPETVMPFGAKQVWVRGKATITRRHVSNAEDTGSPQKKRRTVEIRKGRLRMIARRPAVVRGECNCIACQNCISQPCANCCSWDCFSEPT